MYNLSAIFAKIPDICKDFAKYLVNKMGSLLRRD